MGHPGPHPLKRLAGALTLSALAAGLAGCSSGEWARAPQRSFIPERTVVAERILVPVEPRGPVTPFFVVHQDTYGQLYQRYAVLSRRPANAIPTSSAQLDAEIRAIRRAQQARW